MLREIVISVGAKLQDLRSRISNHTSGVQSRSNGLKGVGCDEVADLPSVPGMPTLQYQLRRGNKLFTLACERSPSFVPYENVGGCSVSPTLYSRAPAKVVLFAVATVKYCI